MTIREPAQYPEDNNDMPGWLALTLLSIPFAAFYALLWLIEAATSA